MTSNSLRAAATAACLCATSAYAAPILKVSDKFTNNIWNGPTSCSNPPTPACALLVNSFTGPTSGWILSRFNSTASPPFSAGLTNALASDNGVMHASVNGNSTIDVVARSRFRETYTFTGAPTTSFIVPFDIKGIQLFTRSEGPYDKRQVWMRIDIRVNNVKVAFLEYQAQSRFDGNLANDFVLIPAPVPVAGVTLPAGFLTFAGVTIPDRETSIFGPGGLMQVDFGAFAPGQVFKLDYRMSCRMRGKGINLTEEGGGNCFVGDPFSISSGPGFDLGGMAEPADTPTPATLTLFGLGALALAGRVTARRRAAAG